MTNFVKNEVFEKHRSEDKESRHDIKTILTKHGIALGKIQVSSENTELHLGNLNGKVARHEEKINDDELWKAEFKGKLKMLSILITVFFAPIAIGATLYVGQLWFNGFFGNERITMPEQIPANYLQQVEEYFYPKQ